MCISKALSVKKGSDLTFIARITPDLLFAVKFHIHNKIRFNGKYEGHFLAKPASDLEKIAWTR
jgi:hypothetical protein